MHSWMAGAYWIILVEQIDITTRAESELNSALVVAVIPHSRSAINNLISSMKLEEELPLPPVKHGRYHFFNALKPAAMYSAKEVADAAAASTMRWTLALWDEDQQEICVIKYRG